MPLHYDLQAIPYLLHVCARFSQNSNYLKRTTIILRLIMNSINNIDYNLRTSNNL